VDEGATDSRVIGVVCCEPATCAGARPVPLVTDVAHSYDASGISVMREVRDINEPGSYRHRAQGAHEDESLQFIGT
jgi:hypothetical protein